MPSDWSQLYSLQDLVLAQMRTVQHRLYLTGGAALSRAYVHGQLALKLEFVNDVPFRVGQPWEHTTLGLVDTKVNILANKISALVDRQEPKDLADIFWLCCRDQLDILQAIEHAGGKAAGIFPPIVAQAVAAGLSRGVPRVDWCVPPSEDEFRAGPELWVRRIVG